jgi:2-phosphosulfolactate phosphatase
LRVPAVRGIGPPRVTFVVTGHDCGDEDLACGRYLEALLRGEAPDPGPYLDRVRGSAEARAMTPDRYPTIEADLDICTRLDAFPFAMRVHKEAGRPVLRVV